MIKIRFVNPDKPKKSVPAERYGGNTDLDAQSGGDRVKGRHLETAAERKAREVKQAEITALLEGKEFDETDQADDADSDDTSRNAKPDTEETRESIRVSEAEQEWLHTLRWRENPFRDAPKLPLREYFVGRQDARRALGTIVRCEGRFAIIEGTRGTGTSTLLRWLAEELAEHPTEFRIISLRAPVSIGALIPLLTDPYKGFFSSYSGTTHQELAAYLAKREKRRIAVLFDDADDLGALEELFKELIGHPNIVIVLAGRAPKRLREPNVLVTLSRLDHAATIEFVRKRIVAVGGNGTHPLSAELLTDLWQDAQGDLHLFLGACEDAAKAAARKPSHSATEDAIVDEGYERERGHDASATKHAHTGRSDGSAASSPKKRSEFDSLIEGLDEPAHKRK